MVRATGNDHRPGYQWCSVFGPAGLYRQRVQVDIITPEEVKERHPLVETSDVLGGTWIPSDGQGNPADITLALAKGARMGGARLFEDTKVTGIIVENGRAVGVRTEMYKGQQFEVRAEQVISNADLPRTLTELMPQDQQTAVQSWPHAANDMKMAAALFICCLNVKGDML